MSWTQVAPLLQSDPKWGKVVLGNNKPGSKWTIASDGCAITGVAMMCGMTPDKVNEALKPVGFTPADGRLATWNIRKFITGHPRYVSQSDIYARVAFPRKEIEAVVDHLKRGNPALIEVDSVLSNDRHNQHFVLGVGAFGTDLATWQIIINDPLRGDQVLLTPRYGATLARALVRVIYYTQD